MINEEDLYDLNDPNDVKCLMNGTYSAKHLELAKLNNPEHEKKADVTFGFGTVTFHNHNDGKDIIQHTAPMMALVPSKEGGVEAIMFHDKPETKD